MLDSLDGLISKLRSNRKNIGKSQREKIVLGQRELCNHCSKPIGNSNFDIDHRDGNSSNNSIGNLQALCLDCHRDKTKRQAKMRVKTQREEKNLFGFEGMSASIFGDSKPKKKTTKRKTSIKRKKKQDDFGFKGLLDYGNSETKSKRRKKKSDDDPFGFKGMMDY